MQMRSFYLPEESAERLAELSKFIFKFTRPLLQHHQTRVTSASRQSVQSAGEVEVR